MDSCLQSLPTVSPPSPTLRMRHKLKHWNFPRNKAPSWPLLLRDRIRIFTVNKYLFPPRGITRGDAPLISQHHFSFLLSGNVTFYPRGRHINIRPVCRLTHFSQRFEAPAFYSLRVWLDWAPSQSHPISLPWFFGGIPELKMPVHHAFSPQDSRSLDFPVFYSTLATPIQVLLRARLAMTRPKPFSPPHRRPQQPPPHVFL